MIVTALKTEKVLPRSTTLTAFLERSLKKFPANSILVITSKVVALCEGRVVPLQKISESTLKQEADYYLPKEKSRYGIPLTIKDHAFIARAGIPDIVIANAYFLPGRRFRRELEAAAHPGAGRGHIMARHNARQQRERGRHNEAAR
mgnify:CR=1 FL=1